MVITTVTVIMAATGATVLTVAMAVMVITEATGKETHTGKSKSRHGNSRYLREDHFDDKD